MTITITGISSMAMGAALKELGRSFENHFGMKLDIESLGGVDAARRVAAGEAFDLVFLAADAIDKLIASGRLEAGSRLDLARSAVAVAVKTGMPKPDIGTEDALKRAVLAAPSIGYSTGPSGAHVLGLFDRWGVAETLKGRTVQAQPGIPVAKLLVQGDAALGFQQLSELFNMPGIEIVGLLPGAAGSVTTFSAGLGKNRPNAAAARAALAFMNTPGGDAIKRRHGLESAQP